MRLLLDTHVLLWALLEPGRLGATTRAAIEDTGNDVLFSAASIWEIAIKAGLGRANFGVRPEEVAVAARDTGFRELPVGADVAARVTDLASYHRDPFDRLLIAQAMAEPARLYTANAVLTQHPELVTLVP